MTFCFSSLFFGYEIKIYLKVFNGVVHQKNVTEIDSEAGIEKDSENIFLVRNIENEETFEK